MKSKFSLSLLTLTSLVVSTQTAIAQQIPIASPYTPSNRIPVSDNTLGTQVSGAGGNFDITGGVSKGQTLFHSFTDFSVPTSGQANFLNPVGNRDIITRVTGNSFSDINGLVNTNGANFFLINPSGIVFGPNAQLNVGQAFMGSTANSIDLVSGGRTITFGTNPSGDTPLLSVAPNVLFDVSRLKLGGGAGAISNFGTLQTTNPNQYIGLIGGNVNMNGGQINAPSGRVELGGLLVAGAVGLSSEGNNLKAQFPTSVGRGDVALTDQSGINVTGTGRGDVTIAARNIDLLGGSTIRSGIGSGLGTLATLVGDIQLNATGKIAVIAESVVANNVNSDSIGQGGNLIVNAGSLLLQDGAVIAAATAGQGNGGNISIQTTGDVTINGNNSAAGISSTTLGQGSAGKITIESQGNILLTNSGLIAAAIAPGANGNSQGISITTKNLNLSNSSFISSNSFGDRGNGGDIAIKVSGAVGIAGTGKKLSSGIASGVGLGTVGTGGNITLDTGSFSLRDGAQLETSTSGTGNAGNVTVMAKEGVSLINGDIVSSVESSGVGKGGNININAAFFSLTDGANLIASTFGQGSAGNILLNSGKVLLNRGDIFATSSNTTGGNITIKDTDYLILRNNSSIATNSDSTSKNGNGGNITISSPVIVATSGSNDITANANQGAGGQVKITSQGLFGIQYRPKGQASPLTNDITASSSFGRDGSVSITTPGTDPGKDSTELPNATTDASNQISQVCSASNRQNKLTVTGRGGLPPNANDPLTSDVIWQDARANSTQQNNVTKEISTPAKLAPLAVGWVFDGKGKVTLVAASGQGQPTKTTVVCPNVRQ